MKPKEITAALRALPVIKSARVTGWNSIRITTSSGSTETVSVREAERILIHQRGVR